MTLQNQNLHLHSKHHSFHPLCPRPPNSRGTTTITSAPMSRTPMCSMLACPGTSAITKVARFTAMRGMRRSLRRWWRNLNSKSSSQFVQNVQQQANQLGHCQKVQGQGIHTQKYCEAWPLEPGTRPIPAPIGQTQSTTLPVGQTQKNEMASAQKSHSSSNSKSSLPTLPIL